jgi:DNA-directed RNA polymerase subunit beta
LVLVWKAVVASDSRVLLSAEGDGVVEYVDATEIRVRYKRSEDEREWL